MRYRRRRTFFDSAASYEIVRDNLDTLYTAIDDGATGVRIPKHAKKELDAFLDCGLLCRGFARLWCARCNESRLVSFSCKGRGFCQSCMGRRMCATSANLIDHVLPEVAPSIARLHRCSSGDGARKSAQYSLPTTTARQFVT